MHLINFPEELEISLLESIKPLYEVVNQSLIDYFPICGIYPHLPFNIYSFTLFIKLVVLVVVIVDMWKMCA